MKQISSGNVKPLNIGRGWFLGQFVDQRSPFHNRSFELKWAKQKKGEKSKDSKKNKRARTLTVLIYGKIRFVLGRDKTIILSREGDFLFFDKNVFHSYEIMKDSLAIVVRWPSLKNDQVAIRPSGRSRTSK